MDGKTFNSRDYLESARLEILVRPDCIQCFPDDAGEGIIVDREFQGAFYLCRVRLPSGVEVRCLLSHIDEIPAGGAVRLRMREGHQARLFCNDRSVDLPAHCR